MMMMMIMIFIPYFATWNMRMNKFPLKRNYNLLRCVKVYAFVIKLLKLFRPATAEQVEWRWQMNGCEWVWGQEYLLRCDDE